MAGLTQAELDGVIQRLVDGVSPADVAAAAGLDLAAVETYLAHVRRVEWLLDRLDEERWSE